MTRGPDLAKRSRLLDQLVEHVYRSGMNEQSTRTMAEALGISTRMLIHYFGTMDRLRFAVMQEIGERFRGQAMAIPPESMATPSRFIGVMVNRLQTPEYLRVMKVFFELFGLAAQRPEKYGRFAETAVRSYLPLLDQVAGAWGVAEADRRRFSTGLLAVGRGLTADMAATGDLERVRETAEWFGHLLDREVADPSNKAAGLDEPA